MDTKSAKVAGIDMRWEERGTGRPVVFLHGIPTSPRLWRHVLPRVAGARALAWEMVGYGASIGAGRGRDLSVAAQADYLASWLRALGLERAILAGHDLGGGVAQIAAVRHPELVGGLALMNCIAYDSWPIPSVRALRALGPLVARLPDAAVFGILAMLMVRGHDDPGRMRESLRVHRHPYAAADGAHRVRKVHSCGRGRLNRVRTTCKAAVGQGVADYSPQPTLWMDFSHPSPCWSAPWHWPRQPTTRPRRRSAAPACRWPAPGRAKCGAFSI